MSSLRHRSGQSKLSSQALGFRRSLNNNKTCIIALLSMLTGVIGGCFLSLVFLNDLRSPHSRFGLRIVAESARTGLAPLSSAELYRNSKLLIDIDIGTYGSAIDREADKLVTFDPFDEVFVNDSLERYPFAIADYTGSSTFFRNDLSPDCSSMNAITTFYNETLRDERIDINCNHQKIPMDGILRCSHPPPEHLKELDVEVKRLSDVLTERGFTKVNHLKIDAQGSDFSILKDVLENAPHVTFNEIKAECQDYVKTIPLYLADNDCRRMENYVLDKFPSASVKWQMNVCWSEEYNLIISNMTEPEP